MVMDVNNKKACNITHVTYIYIYVRRVHLASASQYAHALTRPTDGTRACTLAQELAFTASI